MANASKSTTLYSNNGYGYTLTASFNENSTSTENNTSNITCTATFSASNTNWYTSYASTLTIYWHDNKENYDRQVASINFAGIDKYSSKTASGTIDVTHNNDGNLSGYAYAYFTKGSTTTGWACNSGGVSTDWTSLTSIPRSAIITSANNFNDEQNPSFTFTNIGNYQMNVWLEPNPNGTHYCVRNNISNTGSYTWDLTAEERNQLRQACTGKTCTIRIGVYTIIGGQSYASYKDVTYSIVNANPTIESLSYEDTNTRITNITQNNQLIVRNQSSLSITGTTLTALKGATLSSVTTTLNALTFTQNLSGTTQSSVVVGYFNKPNISSNTNATITLTDSRGFTNSYTLPITFIDYQKPSAQITFQRESDFYSNTNLKVDCTYSSLNNNNQITINYEITKGESSEYSVSVATTYTDGRGRYCFTLTSDLENIFDNVADNTTCDFTYVYNDITYTASVTRSTEYGTPYGLITSYDSERNIPPFSAGENLYNVTFALSGGGGQSGTIQNNTNYVLNLDNKYSWHLLVTITDLLGSSVTYSNYIDKGIPIVFFDRLKRSVGVNCFPVGDETLEVGGVNVLDSAKIIAKGSSSKINISQGQTIISLSSIQIIDTNYAEQNNNQITLKTGKYIVVLRSRFGDGDHTNGKNGGAGICNALGQWEDDLDTFEWHYSAFRLAFSSIFIVEVETARPLFPIVYVDDSSNYFCRLYVIKLN